MQELGSPKKSSRDLKNLVMIHPLVIMNVSEHWTRISAQESSDRSSDWTAEILIMKSFELNFDRIEGDVVIDRDK